MQASIFTQIAFAIVDFICLFFIIPLNKGTIEWPKNLEVGLLGDDVVLVLYARTLKLAKAIKMKIIATVKNKIAA